MSVFGLYFVTGLLRAADWPRTKGFFLKKAVIDAMILDSAIGQMIDWGATLGAERPILALKMIAEMFRDRDWTGDERPKIKMFIDAANADNEKWRSTDVVAPHELIAAHRFAGADAYDRAAKGVLKKGAKWKGPVINLKDFNELRVPLEHWLLQGILWGIGNPNKFEAWYRKTSEDVARNLDLMGEAGLEVEPLDRAQHLTDSELILKNYEDEITPLPPIPDSLMADAKALGVRM